MSHTFSMGSEPQVLIDGNVDMGMDKRMQVWVDVDVIVIEWIKVWVR